MRVDLWLYASLGLANASVLKACVPQDQDAATVIKDIDGFQPKTQDPQFFSLMVDQQCRDDNQPTPPATKDCTFDGFAVRLENGIVVATRYNRWWSSKLTIFFVDDDKKIRKVRLPTFSHTLAVNESRLMILQVSGKLQQLFLDAVTGALRYADVGFLPPNSVAVSFYKLGDNPLGNLDPSPAYFAWPSTEGCTSFFGQGTWWFCLLSSGQYQVFVSDANFGDSQQGGVQKVGCTREGLAAINADPVSPS
jgi:hypothetical protein